MPVVESSSSSSSQSSQSEGEFVATESPRSGATEEYEYGEDEKFDAFELADKAVLNLEEAWENVELMIDYDYEVYEVQFYNKEDLLEIKNDIQNVLKKWADIRNPSNVPLFEGLSLKQNSEI